MAGRKRLLRHKEILHVPLGELIEGDPVVGGQLTNSAQKTQGYHPEFSGGLFLRVCKTAPDRSPHPAAKPLRPSTKKRDSSGISRRAGIAALKSAVTTPVRDCPALLVNPSGWNA